MLKTGQSMVAAQATKKKRLVIWANKKVFPSARKLKDALKEQGIKQVILLGATAKKYKYRPNDIIINWGNSKYAPWNADAKFVNVPSCVSIAVNKLNSFVQFSASSVSCPVWTTDADTVEKEWLSKELTVVARKTLTGFGGAGIELFDVNVDSIPVAPLYVQYKKKKHEYRVHVFNGEVIDVTWKRKKTEADDANYQIRNYANGWVYCRENIEEPEDLRSLAIQAVTSLGLNFGAVDIIWNKKENKSYVLEVNTAPGLVGTTLESYTKAIKGVYDESP